MARDLPDEGDSAFDPEMTVTELDPSIAASGDPMKLGRFVRQTFLGRGGGGTVYRAFDLKLNREVAIKIPMGNIATNAEAKRVFLREVYATSRLRHPYVVTLFDYECSDTEAILVYEFIDGETLQSWIEKHPAGVNPTQVADVVKKIAQALQHAHSQNILHRDVKPSNVLLDHHHAASRPAAAIKSGDPLEPRLADFGLAQLLHDHTRTESHQKVVGSIHYIPPEVIRRSADAYSHESDVYSLGVVLYELLTGVRPFTGASIGEVLQRIGTGDMILPRRLNPLIPRDLETICLRAMAIEPANRYLTAALFAEDLDRFLTHRPVLARHPGLMGIASRWIRRNQAIAVAMAVSSVAIAAFITLIVLNNQRLSAVNKTISDTNRQLSYALKASRSALYRNEQMAYCSAMRSASDFIESGRLRDARTILRSYENGTELQAHRDFEWQHLRNKIRRQSQVVWKSPSPIYCVATHEGNLLAAGADSAVTVIEMAANQVVRQWGTSQGEINSIAVDDLDQSVYTSGDDGSIACFDFLSGKERWRVQAFSDQRAYQLIHSAANHRVFCIGHEGSIAAIDTTTHAIAPNWTTPQAESYSFGVLNEDKLLVGSTLGSLHEVSTQTGQADDAIVIMTSTALKGMVVVDHERVGIVTDQSLVIYNPEKRSISQIIKLPEIASSISYESVNRCYVVTMKEGGIHRFVEDDQGQVQAGDRWVNDGARIYLATTMPGDEAVITADDSGALVKWGDLVSDHITLQEDGKQSAAAIDVSLGRPGLDWPEVAIGCDRGVSHYNFMKEAFEKLDDQSESVTCIKHWPGQFTLIGSKNQDACIVYDVADKSINSTPRRESLGLLSPLLLSGSLDGSWIGGGNQQQDMIWFKAVKAGSDSSKFPAFNPMVISLQPSANRVFWNNGYSLQQCSLSQPHVPSELYQFKHVPENLAMSGDRQLLAIGLSNHEVRLWDLPTGTLRNMVLAHTSRLSAIAFTPSGRTLITLSAEGVIRCWNIETGELTLEKNLVPPVILKNLVLVAMTSDARFAVLRYADHGIHLVRLY